MSLLRFSRANVLAHTNRICVGIAIVWLFATAVWFFYSDDPTTNDVDFVWRFDTVEISEQAEEKNTTVIPRQNVWTKTLVLDHRREYLDALERGVINPGETLVRSEFPTNLPAFCDDDRPTFLWHIGAMKSGTSALFQWMSANFVNVVYQTRSQGGPLKEVHYFDRRGGSPFSDYVKAFNHKDSVEDVAVAQSRRFYSEELSNGWCTRMFDMTPAYLRVPKVPHLARAAIDSLEKRTTETVRLSLSLRHPVHRAYSQANHFPFTAQGVCSWYNSGSECRTAAQILQRQYPRGVPFIEMFYLATNAYRACVESLSDENKSGSCFYAMDPFASSLYYMQLERWFEEFDRTDFLVLSYEEDIAPAREDRQKAMELAKTISWYYGLPKTNTNETEFVEQKGRGVTTDNNLKFARPTMAEVAEMEAYYIDEFEKLHILLGRDTPFWNRTVV